MGGIYIAHMSYTYFFPYYWTYALKLRLLAICSLLEMKKSWD